MALIMQKKTMRHRNYKGRGCDNIIIWRGGVWTNKTKIAKNGKFAINMSTLFVKKLTSAFIWGFVGFLVLN